MAKYQVPLNGSNFINIDRQKAFQDALVDDHRIDCRDDRLIPAAAHKAISTDTIPGEHNISFQAPGVPAIPAASPGPSEQALDHTYQHQIRTMEIHQQYLAQQTEYIQLITAVLDQQGKVLDTGNGSPNAGIIETFQRTLDNFHLIREQGLKVHQDFLACQAEFSERYLTALEGSQRYHPAQAEAAEQPPTSAQALTEWVVREPHIILDGLTSQPGASPADDPADAAGQAPTQPIPQDSAALSSETLAKALLQIVAEKTGYPAEMLELDMDLEADLGIDSIKRVEILGALEDEIPSLPTPDMEVLSQTRTLQEIVSYMESKTGKPAEIAQPAAQSASQPEAESAPPLPGTPQPSPEVSGQRPLSAADLTAILLEIVADKTGYPAEMLEPDMDLEADLGIDSIKRVEILGAMEERTPGLPAIEPESLAELRTLGQIVELMGRSQGPQKSAPPAEIPVKKKAEPVELDNTPIGLVSLPAPDKMDFAIPGDHPVIVSNEGGEFTLEVVKALKAEGWKVVVWDYPTSLIADTGGKLPKGIGKISQQEFGKEAIESGLTILRADFGNPLGFIHLHPPADKDELLSDKEEELIKQLFLLAGSIKPDLTGPDRAVRPLFLAVTRTDGALGINNKTSFQAGSGLTGLAKTLHREWPDVFCRAVDISPAVKAQDASRLLIQEIHDPDQGLLEVGLSSGSRVTIQREYENQT